MATRLGSEMAGSGLVLAEGEGRVSGRESVLAGRERTLHDRVAGLVVVGSE